MLPEKILVSACIVTCHYLISDCVHPNAVTELIGHVEMTTEDMATITVSWGKIEALFAVGV